MSNQIKLSQSLTKTREKKIETYLKKRAEALGFMCIKFTSPSNDGVPDRVVIGHGRVFFVELKAPGESLRKLQEYVVKEFRKFGADVYVVDTKEKVDEVLSLYCSNNDEILKN